MTLLSHPANVQRFCFPALTEYMNCYIGKRPAGAIVTKKDTDANKIKDYQDMLMAAGVDKLKKGKMVEDITDRLVKYTGSTEKYVEPYSEYYNAVQKTEDTNAASTVLVSFALQIVAIFAYARLI